METFTKLFGSLPAFVYHCFDRIVILGHLPLLTRPENIVHFFRDLPQTGAITKEVLRRRTAEYNRWVDAFARKSRIPIEWAGKGVRKEDYVRPYLRRMERQNRFGVYFILKSMEVGLSFRSTVPCYPVQDPDYNPQAVRALLRYRPAAPVARQDQPDLRFSNQQAVARQAAERARKNRTWTSCLPGLWP